MRVLFITSRPFWPPRKGEQARLVGFLTNLPREFQVETLSLVPPGTTPIPAPFSFRQSFVPLPLGRAVKGVLWHPLWPAQVALHYHSTFLASVQEAVVRFQPQVVLFMLSRIAWLLPFFQEIPCVVDFVDSLALNMRQKAKASPVTAPLWLLESARCARWDSLVLQQAALATVVAKRDREEILRPCPQLSNKLRILPFGVTVNEQPLPTQASPPTLLLSGNLGYFPTAGGAIWFAHRVWPALKALHPHLRLIMAGARPGRRLLALARLGIEVIANPPDLAPLRQQATLAIAPLLPGSGTPIKILEAMASRLPVVASPAAVAGLDDLPPEAITVAAEAKDWITAIDQLLRQPVLAQRQAAAALLWVKEHHDLRRISQSFATFLFTAAHG